MGNIENIGTTQDAPFPGFAIPDAKPDSSDEALLAGALGEVVEERLGVLWVGLDEAVARFELECLRAGGELGAATDDF